ncbi:dTMP kinase [Candidatus Aciduliprofundum boonei]|uniref:Probable thymidylate kinase n=1 Tax=Aciduliprofundum boonei (strain DSM 19572 / T469) TaxID=439481 RepID=B5IA95_ACIB4|nr:dTMP kinase [Candidatus Aciduliprofundum boonei]ADD08267.1 thymidylate kinase [Aciduliprofundum boonei T469]EDY36872.1 thymidylate kinase [Aciduliprofundum boonei T469]HII55035.1 dTMP kinase [Candidatus Aciduliprofundum boonei]
MFIVFEGIDGSGKSTIARRIAKHLSSLGHDIFLTEEPTTTWMGKDVRRAIEEEKNPLSQALLFFADRAEHVEAIKKNLEDGKIVISDRYVYSTFAYQGAQMEKLMPLDKALKWLEGVYEPMRLDPDMVILLKIEPRRGLDFVNTRDFKEKFEREEFLERVQDIYMDLADKYGFFVVDSNRNLNEVYEDVRKIIDDRI